ncbi:MAG: type II secretion system protein GspH [Zetaproteobacteria bacterium CG1_02_53_45]|nr:MAG: type II secretion system protein GspH [Zetaproteobacteria bacterium CG1_02_53_45]
MRIIPNSSGSSENRQAAVCCGRGVAGNECGFSLIELMIVIVIIAIMTGLAVPAFSDWRQSQAVRTATQSLLSHMKQARVLAISENRNVSITFTSTSYTFDADTTGSCGACKAQLIPLGQFSGNIALSPTTTRTFSSRGTSNAGSVTLTAGSHSRGITLNVIGRAYM